jgi:hypothetical protein
MKWSAFSQHVRRMREIRSFILGYHIFYVEHSMLGSNSTQADTANQILQQRFSVHYQFYKLSVGSLM